MIIWNFIHNISPTPIQSNNPIFYNIITKDGIINVITDNNNSITFRDYEQIKSNNVNDMIDKYSEKILND